MKQLGLLYQHFHTAGRTALSRLYKSTVLSAPAGLLCLCVGPPPHYLYQQTEGYTGVCCKVSHGPLVPRLSGPHPNYELASLTACRKRQKLLLCKHNSACWFKHTTLSIHSSPPPSPSPRLHQCMALYRPITKTSAHLHSFPSVVTVWNKLSS